MKRREFFTRTAQAALLAAPVLVPVARAADADPFELAPDEAEDLAALVDVLFPAGDDSPGAREIHAAEYIQLSMVDPDIDGDERKFLRSGLNDLNAFAVKRHGSPFRAVAPANRGQLIADFVADGGGERWISAVLSYVLEAVFGDPNYGVNVNQVGWKWIDHKPGFPRPPKPKWYRPVLNRRGPPPRRGT